MKKILWVDVGTHYGQEYESAFGPHYKFIWQIFRRFVASKLLLRGNFYKLEDIKFIFKSKKYFKENKSKYDFFFVEANSKIVNKKKVYSNADAVFNFALTSNNISSINVVKLFLADNDSLSQGSSIFLEKSNVNKNFFSLCLGVSPSNFFEALKKYFDQEYEDYSVMLRLNCEGVEDEVIYSAHKSFNENLKLVSGSLKDVKGVKGEKAYEDMKNFMDLNNLPFIYFSSDINSWAKAHSLIKEL